ncbi:MAG: hypothetical protein M3Y32_11175, partial [Pseudomonadota bacterium]|nr:hypothetical protein [Pseudomonadota bacterium]
MKRSPSPFVSSPFARSPLASAGAVLLVLGFALALAACASSSITRFHTLQALPTTAPTTGYAGPPLQVRSVVVPT